MSASINEEERMANVVFLSEIAEKHQHKLLILDGKYVSVNEFVCPRIDGGIQPEPV
jgi:hypothetical protein